MTNNRAEIDAKYKWDLSAIYRDEAAFNSDYKKAEDLIAAFPKHRETMGKSAEGLYNTLLDETSLERLIHKLYAFAHLNSDLDKSDNTYLALLGRVRNLAAAADAASFFVSPEIIRLPEEVIEKWYEEFPALNEYRRNIERQQRYRPHTLSDECEKLLAELSSTEGTHSDIRSILVNAEFPFGKIVDENKKKIELGEALYGLKLTSPVRTVRRAAFKSLYDTYEKFGNTLTALISSHIKERTTNARIRGYKDSITASTFRDEVTPEIYNNLIDTVSRHMDVLFRYYDLKKMALSLPKLHMYDIYTPMIKSDTKEYPFDEAVEEVLDAVRVLGDEYHDTLEAGIKERHWVDVYPTKGKRGGAYSSHSYDTQPYILLNYTGKLNDVSTLAHEAGHSMHSYFSTKANSPQQYQYTIFVAEVASTVNELLFSHKKLRESESVDEKLTILNQIMETYKGTLYRQTMFAEFEREMHALVEAGTVLTKDLLTERYYKLIKKYFGSHVVCDKEIAREWMRIPHFYSSFYVYKYATCISAASSIVHRIETEGAPYIEKYLKFLSAGGSMSPVDSLKLAEIDMTKPEVVEDAIRDFAAAIDQFEALYQEKNA